MASLILKLCLSAATVILIHAVILLIVCLIRETENLKVIQSLLIDLVNQTPLEKTNHVIKICNKD